MPPRYHNTSTTTRTRTTTPSSSISAPTSPIVVLNVAEKPSVARALAGVFHRMPQAQEGAPMRREAAQIFTHNNVCFPSIFSQANTTQQQQQQRNNNHNNTTNTPTQIRPHTMITTSVRGHLASIEFGKEYGWSKCDPIQLFDAPLETVYRDDMIPLQQMLLRLSQTVQAVILWLDCDREGEAISDEVSQVCVQGNPHLQPYVYRAKFSTVLDGEIRNALSTLGRINEYHVQAVQARSEMDLRVGAAFTRFQTLRLQKKFILPSSSSSSSTTTTTTGNHGSSSTTKSGGGVISYGPCQFPTLGFIVERWARIETFIAEDFWFLEVTLRIQQQQQQAPSITRTTIETTNTTDNDTTTTTNNNNIINFSVAGPSSSSSAAATTTTTSRPGSSNGRPIIFNWKRSRLYDRTITLALYESCLEDGIAVVTHMDGRSKNRWRPVPLATVELQKRASSFLRIGSETLMAAAEQLYQQGYISYPRTETEKFRPEFQHRPLLQDFATCTGGGGLFATYANKLLTENGFQNPRAGQNDDQAHPPITPCKAVDPASIADPTQRNVYILVVKHYLACCSRDAIGRETTITVKISTEEFVARGLMIEEKNWLEIYEPWERWSTGQGELPFLQIGSRVVPESLLMKDGQTTPPQPITEPELITLMDNCGIGTDATIAQHISTVQERDYAYKDQSHRFSPTPLGIALIEGYNSMGYQLNKPDLRRETEYECNLVANRQKTKEDIVQPILAKMKDTYIVATREAHKLDDAMARHFQRVGTGNDMVIVQANFSECGKCQRRMVLKQERGDPQQQPQQQRRRGGNNSNNNNNDNTVGGGNRNSQPRKLLVCETCQDGWVMPQKGQLRPKTANDNDTTTATTAPNIARCPICNFQVVTVARGDGYEGNGYNLCPHCYSDPPADHGGTRSGGNFPCFSCSHPTCSLAGGTPGGDVEVYACPFCRERHIQGGKVILKKNSRGYTLSCSNYSSVHRCSYTVWLPRASQSVSISTDETTVCTHCSTDGPVRKVSFVWKAGSVPPHLGRESTACIRCDTRFRQDVQIQLPQMNTVMMMAPSNNNNNNSRASNSNNRTQQQQQQQQHYGNGNRAAVVTGSNWSRTSSSSSSNNSNNNRPTNHHHRLADTTNNSNNNHNTTSMVCFKCNQPGHYANACPTRRQYDK